MKKALILSIILSFSFIGCSSISQPQVKEIKTLEIVPQNQAYIYIIRKSGMLGAAGEWAAYVDDIFVGNIYNGAKILVKVAPGEHTITPKKTFLLGKATNLRTKVSLEAGKSYYYIHTAKATGLLSMDFLYQPISTEEGLSLSHNYKLISINDLGKAEIKNPILCLNWSINNGITDEEKAWLNIHKNIDTLRKEIFKVKNPKFNYDQPIKINNINISYERLITGVKVITKINDGDYRGAAEEVANETVSYLVPIAGQYKALLDATKTSIDSILENWTADLYTSESYRELLNIINEEVLRGRQHKKPYYPSEFLSKNSKPYKKMWERERKFFIKWKASLAYDRDFGFGDDKAYDKKSLLGIASRSQNNRARIRQLLGKEAHPSEIFKHFYRKIVTDQKDFIKLTYNETMEDMMFSEEERMRPKIIKSVCSELYNLSKIKK